MHSPRKESFEEKIYGRNACWAIWKARPQDVIRIYINKIAAPRFKECLQALAKTKRAYHVVENDELVRVTGSNHHEGVCFLVKSKKQQDSQGNLDQILKSGSPIVFLDGVENPHNFGALVRVAAHFGVRAILGDEKTLPKLSGASYRVAQGGAEFVDIIRCQNIDQIFKKAAEQGYQIIAVTTDGKGSLLEAKLNSKTIFILGSEGKGVSASLKKQSHSMVFIPGTGNVQSLNVSVAGALALGEYWRQHGQNSKHKTKSSSTLSSNQKRFSTPTHKKGTSKK